MAVETDLIEAPGGKPVLLTKQWASKGYLNLNGTGTIAVRESKGISSVTDMGTGTYEPNLASPMTTNTYAALASCLHNTSGYSEFVNSTYSHFGVAYTVSAFRMAMHRSDINGWADTPQISGIIHGDLAP